MDQTAPRQPGNPTNRWLKQRRPYFITRLYRDFADIFLAFQDIYRNFMADRVLAFKALDKLVGAAGQTGSLWQLKDLCHQLWRQEQCLDAQGCLLDWVTGSLFHEAMKLKENLYLSENYRPILQYHTGTSFFGHECRRFMAKTASEIASQMENMGFLFGQANYLLRAMLVDQNGNSLLLRLLLEDRRFTDDLWFEPLPEIFNELFDRCPEQGFLKAAQSYQEGHWFQKAKDAYAHSLRLAPQCDLARQQLPQLQAIIAAAGEE